ncbi:MAG: hypothetical protein GX282_00870 [Campylobacteraceae bacterium]|nr:hypothetical protein [Campylobacteraceae bacterium]
MAIERICWDFVPRLQFSRNIGSSLSSKFQILPIVYSDSYEFYLPQGVKYNGDENLELFLSRFMIKLHDIIDEKNTTKLIKLLPRHIEPCFDMSLFHSQSYLEKLSSDRETLALATNLKINSCVTLSMIDRYILEPYRHICYGTYLAANLAINEGFAINLTGGFGYVRKDGKASVPYNDIALSILQLHKDNPELKILYISLGSKKSVGVFELAKTEQNFWAFECMLKSNLPDDETEKGLENVKFKAFPPNITKERFLEQTKELLTEFIDEVEPNLIIYSCDLTASKDEVFLRERDCVVTAMARERQIPLCVCLSGIVNLRYKELNSVFEGLVDDMFLVKV